MKLSRNILGQIYTHTHGYIRTCIYVHTYAKQSKQMHVYISTYAYEYAPAQIAIWSCGIGSKHSDNFVLTHWGRVTYICVSKLNIIGSDNGLSPGRRQAIIRTNTGILLIGPLGTNFSEMLIEIHTFSFNKMHVKISSAKRRQFCLGLNVLKNQTIPSWGPLYILDRSRAGHLWTVWRCDCDKYIQ